MIIISHDKGVQTVYAHLNTIYITQGQTVTQGQTIGEVGNTGKSTGPHLHFEVRGAKNPFQEYKRTDNRQQTALLIDNRLIQNTRASEGSSCILV